jgi:hypothetical protein
MPVCDQLWEIRNDPRCDGTVLGAGGFVDQEQRKAIAVCELLSQLDPNAEGVHRTLIAHFACRGITPAVAGRLTLAEVERRLSAELHQRRTELKEAENGSKSAKLASIKVADRTRAERRAEWLAKAMLLVQEHPEWSNAVIAEAVGINPSQLSRSKPYRAAADMARSGAKGPPRGYVVRDKETGLHHIEAVSKGCIELDDKSDRGQKIPGSALFREYCSRCDMDASPAVAAEARVLAEIERRFLGSPNIEGIVLRYGFFYSPGTWFHPDGDVAQQVKQQHFPIVGSGEGVWSWLHIEDAAVATAAAAAAGRGKPGIYLIANDQPLAVGQWLPAFAEWLNAPSPPQISVEDALQASGADAVYYGTQMRGASNAKAKRELSFQPRPLEWIADAALAHAR